jgi:hypothetical protein
MDSDREPLVPANLVKYMLDALRRAKRLAARRKAAAQNDLPLAKEDGRWGRGIRA